MTIVKLYCAEELDERQYDIIIKFLSDRNITVAGVEFEYCYYVETSAPNGITESELSVLQWLIAKPFVVNEMNSTSKMDVVSSQSLFGSSKENLNSITLEVGPRLNFSSPFSTNAVSICRWAGLDLVRRVERSRRYHIEVVGKEISKELQTELAFKLHDQMVEMVYSKPVESFDLKVTASDVYHVDVVSDGRKALALANQEMGLAMDDWDLDYYTDLFQNKVRRNPTNVECFDLAQSNSEHCRHWFFGGRMVIDGEEQPNSLFKLVKSTQENTNPNNKIKFSDNSSCIQGYDVKVFAPKKADGPSSFTLNTATKHIILTAETHNFPTAVAPFPGATTGTGGRIRDIQATGRGAHVVAGTAGYSFGCLNIPGYDLPWEDDSLVYPSNFATPHSVIIEASNGASDYGNKYGEPVICGFGRSFGLLVGGERREWIKPIMFSGGIGTILDTHVNKYPPRSGDAVVKVGGPVYRIGVGGGAASSIQVQGDNASNLDLGAVQRGDAEMEQKMNRIIRACIESEEGADNPIRSIHDQGAGGNGNVLKEICEPNGAIIHSDAFELGDPTINVLELWGAEYQESNALLIDSEHKSQVSSIAKREKCQVDFVGEITGTGKVQLTPFGYLKGKQEEQIDGNEQLSPPRKKLCPVFPVDLELEHVLGDMPKKVFNLKRIASVLKPLKLPNNVQVYDALSRVLRLPSVASKRYLTNKVDRSVTGLVAQQQCVGPLHTPLADVAVTALSYWDTKGAATSIGEQPIKTLVSPQCGARMSVGEALTNLSFALITELKDVKCSANWMWPAKLPGEGARMYDACEAMSVVMKQLGIAVDGGKDSLSMAARVNDATVKSPGTVVISTYAACEDITKTITPDFKCPDYIGEVVYVNLSKGQSSRRVGGSALAQVYGQIGDVSADLDDSELFSRCFQTLQTLISKSLITAGHDVSDGGVLTCLLEMAFAGNCGVEVSFLYPGDIDDTADVLSTLFHEELGYILEVKGSHLQEVLSLFQQNNIECQHIGISTASTTECTISLRCGDSDSSGEKVTILKQDMKSLRDLWEQTSFQLELAQCKRECVVQEQSGMAGRRSPPYKLSFNSEDTKTRLTLPALLSSPRVAVIREEGSNGDREMAAAFYTAGFEVHDVTMTDLLSGSVSLEKFQGVAFVGGFSYADVLGSAKGWAATVLYHESVNLQFKQFRNRSDTFSLGVCNGCQLMTLLGWVGDFQDSAKAEEGCSVFMDHNTSGRYESRFSTVRIDDSPSIMLQGMKGSTLGVWVAHGEGKMNFRSADVYSSLSAKKLLPVKFVNDDNLASVLYPFNPNGSPGGAAAICSTDGRHLAMMPHPERCFMTWQWPWMPQDWRGKVHTSPWLRMFSNAYNWCREISA